MTAEDSSFSLDLAIARLDFPALRECLSAHLQKLNNAARQRGVDLSKDWKTCLRFVEDLLGHFAVADDQRWEEIKRNLSALEQTYKRLMPIGQKRSAAPIRSLPALVLEELYEIFNPESPRNPFKSTRDKFRNFLIFLILLHLGLRRGELLILAVNSFRSEHDLQANREVCWLVIDYILIGSDDDEFVDPRSNPPSLKNQLARRLLPVSADLFAVLDVYLQGHRRKSGWPHLLISQKARPLSPRRLDEIFEVATNQLSRAANAALQFRGKDDVRPHDLRHTCAVRRLGGYRAAGFSHDEAVEKLRVFFGWCDDSAMPARYARAYYETDFDTIWYDRYDSYVEAIRTLEGVQ